MRAMSDLGTEIHLHARVFRAGGDWYADIDDHTDPQPDDPFWYGYYPTQQEAMDAACDRIAALHRARCQRISQQLSLRTTTSA
jgi:hypothetical protein